MDSYPRTKWGGAAGSTWMMFICSVNYDSQWDFIWIYVHINIYKYILLVKDQVVHHLLYTYAHFSHTGWHQGWFDFGGMWKGGEKLTALCSGMSLSLPPVQYIPHLLSHHWPANSSSYLTAHNVTATVCADQVQCHTYGNRLVPFHQRKWVPMNHTVISSTLR